MIDYDNFRQSLKRLELQFANYQSLDSELPKLIQEAVAESVNYRFKTSYDCSWKILSQYLSEELGVPDVPNSPKPIFRLAAENNLLGGSIERWLRYADARISTSHDYSGEKAKQCLLLMGDFIGDGIALYQTMSGKTWV